MKVKYSDLMKGLTPREVKALRARFGTKAPSGLANSDLDVDQDKLNALARKLVILKQRGKKKE